MKLGKFCTALVLRTVIQSLLWQVLFPFLAMS